MNAHMMNGVRSICHILTGPVFGRGIPSLLVEELLVSSISSGFVSWIARASRNF